MYTIVVAIPYPIYRIGVIDLVCSYLSGVTIMEISHVEELMKVSLDPSIDLIILEPDFPGVRLQHFFGSRAGQASVAPVLMYSKSDELLVADMFVRMGAAGYVEQKSRSGQLIHAIRMILNGATYISDKVRANGNPDLTGND